MDCKDLMVGDLVSYKDDPSYIVRGTSICEVVTIDNGIDHRNVMDNAINPIPLTEDILMKNGFEYAYNEVSKMQNKQLLVANISGHYIEVRLDKKNVAIWYDYDENESGFYSDVLLDLPRTVHQLQHLLRLCGIEKEIEL